MFQICTLRHGEGETRKRQEVGRGLRICVDKNGVRQDKEVLGDAVHDINTLTVITNESYTDFTEGLQDEIAKVLRERPKKATHDYFTGKTITANNGEQHEVTSNEASRIMIYLEDNGYVDDKGSLTKKYHEDADAGQLEPLDNKLQPIGEGVNLLIQAIYDKNALKKIIQPLTSTIPPLELNKNFTSEEFQALWKEINHKYVYSVDYDSAELIEKAIDHIDRELTVKKLRYIRRRGQQNAEDATKFGDEHQSFEEIEEVSTSNVEYDIVGRISQGANLTRRTVGEILSGMNPMKLLYFKNNPEEFIRNMVKIIREQKATLIVDHIRYHMIDQTYDSDIFTLSGRVDVEKAVKAKKHIMDYVVSDSKGERKFAEELDQADEVVVFAKLPRAFKIPTPVGNYAPDWAIAMERNGVKHIFFIAETKGSMSSMDLKAVEKAKIDCADLLYSTVGSEKVHYHKVATYQDLIDAMTAL